MVGPSTRGAFSATRSGQALKRRNRDGVQSGGPLAEGAIGRQSVCTRNVARRLANVNCSRFPCPLLL